MSLLAGQDILLALSEEVMSTNRTILRAVSKEALASGPTSPRTPAECSGSVASTSCLPNSPCSAAVTPTFPLLAFPIEVLDLIFHELEFNRLPSILPVSKLFYSIASRILYRIIPELPVHRCLACLKILCANATSAALVRKLTIDLTHHRATGNLFRLIRRTLALLPNLRHLSLELSPHDNHFSLTWMLEDCHAQLRTLGTSIRCDPSLAAYLETQPLLTELCLRGFQTKQPFILSPGAMPNLQSFRAVHAGPAIVAAVLRNRPVEVVSTSIFKEDAYLPLDSLVLSSRPIKRLTLMALDASSPDVLIAQIASRLPQLEALHIVVLMAMFDHDMLRESAATLKPFKHLRYLTFMAAGSPSVEDEGQIATAWHKACPTLRTIILPKGKVWFERDGKWTCCREEFGAPCRGGVSHPGGGAGAR